MGLGPAWASQEGALRPLGLWASGQVGEDWAALKSGSGLDEPSLMPELWEAQTAPGAGFLISCLRGRRKNGAKW